MPGRISRAGRPAQLTALLSAVLAAVAGGVALLPGHGPVIGIGLPTWVAMLALASMFYLAEQIVMTVEFRRQAHAFTLAGIPLVLGVLCVAPHDLLLARAVGAGIALALQRVGGEKLFYNISAYALEAVGAAALAQQLLGHRAHVDVLSAVVAIAVLAVWDQLMSLLVLGVIRLHGGRIGSIDVISVLPPAVALCAMTSTAGLVGLVLVNQGPIGCVLAAGATLALALSYRGHVVARRRHQALELVHDFVAEGVGAESVDILIGGLLGRMRQLLRSAQAELMIIDVAEPGSGSTPGTPAAVAQVWTVGEDDRLTRGTRQVDSADWITVRALVQEEPVLAARTTKDRGLRRWLADRGLRDAIVLPLPATPATRGTLTVTDRLGETATFTDDDVTLLQTLTGHLAVAVRSTRLLERLGHDATHDSLTGLSNRADLTDRIEAARADGSAVVAVLLLDLDRFKEVNDLLGHEIGDRLLVTVAQRLRAGVPAGSTVARLGGDEFAVLVPELAGGPDQAVAIAEHLGVLLAQPVAFEEALLSPEASIGVAVAAAGDRHDDLLRQADTAMYTAKSGEARVALYGPDMDRLRLERLALLADLRIALDSHPEQLIVNYQPKIDLTDGTVVSAEALVRWNHPTLGVLGPDRFIPLAESTELIERLTPHVLSVALTACRDWLALGYDVSVAVNLSARNIGDRRLPARVAQALELSGVPADRLILEITESSVMGDPDQTVPILHELADLGLCLSLDDFGTGYSSLSYLQRLPVGEVKIDRSFVLGLDSAEAANSRALIRSITGLAAPLGLCIVAEGVEDEERLQELRELGCHVAQGYHISRPLAAGALHDWLSDRLARHPRRLRLLS